MSILKHIFNYLYQIYKILFHFCWFILSLDHTLCTVIHNQLKKNNNKKIKKTSEAHESQTIKVKTACVFLFNIQQHISSRSIIFKLTHTSISFYLFSIFLINFSKIPIDQMQFCNYFHYYFILILFNPFLTFHLCTKKWFKTQFYMLSTILNILNQFEKYYCTFASPDVFLKIGYYF